MCARAAASFGSTNLATAALAASLRHGTNPILANFRDYGFAGVLPKPVKIHELAALLDRLFGRGEG